MATLWKGDEIHPAACLRPLLCREFVEALEVCGDLQFSEEEQQWMNRLQAKVSQTQNDVRTPSRSPSPDTRDSSPSSHDGSESQTLDGNSGALVLASSSTDSKTVQNSNNGRKSKTKPKSKPEDKTNDPFKVLYNVTEVTVPETIQGWRRAYGDHSIDFFREQFSQAEGTLGYHLINDDDSASKRFLCRYKYSARLEHRNEMDSVRRCYSRIGMFLTFKSYFLNQTGKMVGRVTMKPFLQHLRPVWDSEGDELNWDTVEDNLTLYVNVGRKLERMCEVLGDGHVFYFSNKLTDNWLKRRFNEGEKYYEEGMKRIRDLLEAVDQEEREELNRFGAKLKKFMFVAEI